MRSNTQPPVNTGQKQVTGRKATQFKVGQSGNPAGRPKGSKNFETYLWEAVERMAKKRKQKPDEIMAELYLIGLTKAQEGKFQFWDSVMDRLHGRPKITADVVTTSKYEGWTKEQLVDEIMKKIEGT